MDHISYSQYNTYVSCPRSWYLAKVVKAEEKQAWYTAIGTAVHQMIEAWLADRHADIETFPSAEEFFFPIISAQMEIEPDFSKWLAGGSADAPVTEGRALQQVKDCFERAQEFLTEIDVWEVECDASGHLPCLEVPIKAYVDIVGEHKKHGPSIVDWKSGTSKPKDNFQLETYRALLDFNGHCEGSALPTVGLWAMLNPKASKARPIDLSAVNPAEVGAKYQKVYEQMKAKLYGTKAGFGCRFCFQQDNCTLNAGQTDRARYYDRAEEDGYPF